MMKRFLYVCLVAVAMMPLTGCKENYSVGEKVGNLIEFTKKGVIWDSWEGRPAAEWQQGWLTSIWA